MVETRGQAWQALQVGYRLGEPSSEARLAGVSSKGPVEESAAGDGLVVLGKWRLGFSNRSSSDSPDVRCMRGATSEADDS